MTPVSSGGCLSTLLITLMFFLTVGTITNTTRTAPPPVAIPVEAGTPIAVSVATPRLLAISTLPRLNPFPTDATSYTKVLIEASDLACNAGARGTFESKTWRELEPSAGQFKLDDLRNSINFNTSRGFKMLLTLQIINTTVKETPPDLMDVSWESQQMKDRFHTFYDQIVPLLNPDVLYLSIGNEVDPYLTAHHEWTAYQSFYEDALAYVHRVTPWIKVGVTSTFGGASGASEKDVAQLNALSDVFILTYYPLNADFTVRPPDVPLTDFPLMVAMAQSRPVILQEVGYPSSAVLGSSEAKQAEFVGNVYRAWEISGSAIPLLSFFVMHDLTPQLCDQFVVYYSLPGNVNFREMLCSLGFRKDDGTPKQAWGAFVKGAQTQKLP